MKKILLLALLLITGFGLYAQLIISQYYEGSSNNKWIEIHNRGTGTVDFSATPYYVCNFNSNLNSPTACAAINSGTLASDATLLVRNSSATLPSYATADFVEGCSFNGDDLVVLTTTPDGMGAYNSRIDEIGNSNDIGGSDWGKDRSFVRNSGEGPSTTWDNSEWTQFSINDVNNAGNGSTQRLGEHATTLLPIELLSLTATPQSTSTLLQWSTASEINNDFMAVERSSNGVDFQEIGRVQGAGTTYEVQEYRFVDDAPVAGTNYYRLRQVDYDGTMDYSEVVSARFGNDEGVIALFPNPVADELTVQLPESWQGETEVIVFDIAGKAVMTTVIDASYQTVAVGQLPEGMYQVVFQNEAYQQSVRLVKQ